MGGVRGHTMSKLIEIEIAGVGIKEDVYNEKV